MAPAEVYAQQESNNPVLVADDAASIRFHQRLGFVEVARMPEIGYKFGRWLDLVLVQRILTPAQPAS